MMRIDDGQIRFERWLLNLLRPRLQLTLFAEMAAAEFIVFDHLCIYQSSLSACMTIALIAICSCGLMIMLMASARACKNRWDIYRVTGLQGYRVTGMQGYRAFFQRCPVTMFSPELAILVAAF
jgi:hypothetical protein